MYFKDICPSFKSSHDYVLEAVGPELQLLIPYEKVVSIYKMHHLFLFFKL